MCGVGGVCLWAGVWWSLERRGEPVGLMMGGCGYMGAVGRMAGVWGQDGSPSTNQPHPAVAVGSGPPEIEVR